MAGMPDDDRDLKRGEKFYNHGVRSVSHSSHLYRQDGIANDAHRHLYPNLHAQSPCPKMIKLHALTLIFLCRQ